MHYYIIKIHKTNNITGRTNINDHKTQLYQKNPIKKILIQHRRISITIILCQKRHNFNK